MRSFSVHVGRLFGVEVRIHLTFLILPLFVFWTEYSVHPSANGPRDLALVGIVLACVAAARNRPHAGRPARGIDSKAVILLPLSGVTVFDESHAASAPVPDRSLETRGPHRGYRAAGESCVRAGCGGRDLCGSSGSKSMALAFFDVKQSAAQPGVGQHLFGWHKSSARISSGWRPHSAGLLRAEHRFFCGHAPCGFDQPRPGHGSDDRGFVQQYVAHHGRRHYLFGGAT